MNSVLVTGSSGFIGFHLCKSLLQRGWEVIGLDSLTNYYDINLKKNRENILKQNQNFTSYNLDISDLKTFDYLFKNHNPSVICHLAAQAGVRYSKEDPNSYLKSNIVGTFNLLNSIKNYNINHLLIASTSSIYSSENKIPYTETQNTDRQISIYASTKKTCEVLSHSYSHIYSIPTTCFRFFTVYGPWGRPDMSYFKFTKAILNNEKIKIHNKGMMWRDFTYINDLTESILKLIDAVPSKKSKIKSDSLSSLAPWRVVNIGNENKVFLKDFIDLLETLLGKKAIRLYIKKHEGELIETFSNNDLLFNLTGFKPRTNINEGLPKFVDWYKEYFRF